ncbi:hypothetical protein IFVP69_C180452 [Vibrio parahaemolyticus]
MAKMGKNSMIQGHTFKNFLTRVITSSFGSILVSTFLWQSI